MTDYKVLLLDRDRKDRDDIKKHLNGHIVTEVSSVIDAVRKLKNEHYDCILHGDTNDGFINVPNEFDCPIIMVSGKQDERFAINMIKSGFSDYLPKKDLELLPNIIDVSVKVFNKQSESFKRMREKLEYSIV